MAKPNLEVCQFVAETLADLDCGTGRVAKPWKKGQKPATMMWYLGSEGSKGYTVVKVQNLDPGRPYHGTVWFDPVLDDGRYRSFNMTDVFAPMLTSDPGRTTAASLIACVVAVANRRKVTSPDLEGLHALAASAPRPEQADWLAACIAASRS